MFLAEPPPSGGDLHFRILGFPIRVHPFFWVASLLLGMSGGKAEPIKVLTWVAVVFASILIHELGHAVLQRRNGGNPRIVLYSFGGLAISDDPDRSAFTQIVISLAGPFAGFIFAAVIMFAMNASGHEIGFEWGSALHENTIPLSLLVGTVYFARFESYQITLVVFYLLVVNIWWGILNLFPIYPLDGGRIARELCTLRGNPRRGIILSLWISIFTAAAVAAVALTINDIFMVIFFAFMAFSNYQTLQSYRQYESDREW
jgi:membrane-associated protease RseP (regulator of RpoE activity)